MKLKLLLLVFSLTICFAFIGFNPVNAQEEPLTQDQPPTEQFTEVDQETTPPIEENGGVPIAVWIGAISGILLGLLKVFGIIAGLTKTSKDDEIYRKINEKLDKLPDIFGVSNGQLIKK